MRHWFLVLSFAALLTTLMGGRAALADCTPLPPDPVNADNILCDGDLPTITPGFDTAGGDDVVTVVDGTITGPAELVLGEGADTLNVTGGLIGTSVQFDAGADTLAQGGGMIVGPAFFGAGEDTATVTGGQFASFFMGSENDSVVLRGASLGNAVSGESGDDEFLVQEQARVGAISGGEGNDDVRLEDGETGIVDGEAGDDTIVVIDGTPNAPEAIAGAILGGVGNDSITVHAGRVSLSILGGADNDVIALLGGRVGEVDGQSQDDTITVDGMAMVDTTVTGSNGNDTLHLLGGTIGGDATGGFDHDTLDLAGTTIMGSLLGDQGDDSATWSAGSAAAIDLGPGSDGLTILASVAPASFAATPLAGGDDESSMDGEVDGLTLDGVVGVLPVMVTGWEQISLVNGATIEVHRPGLDNRLLGGELLSLGLGTRLIATGSSPGSFTFAGSMQNLGSLDMQDAEADDLVTVQGDYSGGGSLLVDVVLNDGTTDLADRLSVGGATSAVTQVVVANVGGTGGATGAGPTDGILLIEVGGASDPAAFALLADPEVGSFAYGLFQADGQNWYLQSRLLPETASYPAYVTSGLVAAAADFDALHERLGELRGGFAPPVQAVNELGLWARGRGLSVSFDESTGAAFDQQVIRGYAGADLALGQLFGEDRLLLGAFGQLGAVDSDLPAGAQGSFSTYGGGLYATYLAGGLHLDLVLKAEHLSGTLTAGTLGGEAAVSGFAWGASLEGGWRFELGERLFVEPRARAHYLRLTLDDYEDSAGFTIVSDPAESVAVEGGLRLGANLLAGGGPPLLLYLDAVGGSQLAGTTVATVDGETTVQQDSGGAYLRLGGGAAARFGAGGLSLYVDADWIGGSAVSGFAVTAGLRAQL
jgi:outer membrane autotransporter protein